MDLARLNFAKLHGCGNSFVVLAANAVPNGPSRKELAIKLSSYQFGIGSDGMFIVHDPIGGIYAVDMYNPDGSSMRMCGNGIRCIARYLYEFGKVPISSTELAFNVAGRSIICCSLDGGRTVRVNMGKPSFRLNDIPAILPEGRIGQEMLEVPLSLLGETICISSVSMGSPHCVVIGDRGLASKFGPLLERHDIFPDRANIEFVEIRSSDHVMVEVWERGMGRTLACGTGACAAVVVASRLGKCNRQARVTLPGGDLEIDWDSGTEDVFMTGPTTVVCNGTVFTGELF